MSTLTSRVELSKRQSRNWFGSVPYYVPALVAVVILVILTAVQNPAFFGAGGWQLAVLYSSPLVVLAMAQAPVLMSGGGGIDLSVGPTAGLITVIVVAFLIPAGITSAFGIVTACLLLGLIAGMCNATLVAKLRIPPIIATLATYLVFAGLATYLLKAPIGVRTDSLVWFNSTTFSVPNVAFVILFLGILWLVVMKTSYGRNLRAVGSNDRAAYTAGINVTATRFIAYSIAGLGSGLGGLLLLVVLGGADATVGPDYTLQAIAAAALGGVSLLGGRGGVLGAAAGGFLIFLIQNYLTFLSVSTFTIQIVFGVVLVAAIMINGGWDYLRTRGR